MDLLLLSSVSAQRSRRGARPEFRFITKMADAWASGSAGEGMHAGSGHGPGSVRSTAGFCLGLRLCAGLTLRCVIVVAQRLATSTATMAGAVRVRVVWHELTRD